MKKQLGALGVDGVTYNVDTNNVIYQVPIGKQVVVTTIHCFNGNSASTNIGIWHVKKGGTLSLDNRILYNFAVAANEPCDVRLDIMASNEDMFYVRSSQTGVNFMLWGDES